MCTDTVLLALLLAATKSLDGVYLSITPITVVCYVSGVKTDTVFVVSFDDNIDCTPSLSLSKQKASYLPPHSPPPSHSNIVNMFTVLTSSAAEEDESEEQQKL